MMNISRWRLSGVILKNRNTAEWACVTGILDLCQVTAQNAYNCFDYSNLQHQVVPVDPKVNFCQTSQKSLREGSEILIDRPCVELAFVVVNLAGEKIF